MDLANILSQLLRPIADPAIIAAAIVCGLFFGAVYNRRLGVPPTMVYHKAMAGWGFILTVFLFRLVTSGPTVVGSVLGWIGIGLLWGIYCLFIWIGTRIRFR